MVNDFTSETPTNAKLLINEFAHDATYTGTFELQLSFHWANEGMSRVSARGLE